jgi:hypothetical protein
MLEPTTTMEMLVKFGADNADLFRLESTARIFTDRLIAELIEWTGIITAEEASEFQDLWDLAIGEDV